MMALAFAISVTCGGVRPLVNIDRLEAMELGRIRRDVANPLVIDALTSARNECSASRFTHLQHHADCGVGLVEDAH
jgi:hypothetical protein